MRKYLIRHWKINLLSAFLVIICAGFSVGINLIMVEAIYQIIEFDLTGFAKWMTIDLIGWGLYVFADCIRAFFQNKSICAMNNDYRMDLVEKLSRKSYQLYHEKDSGEYISWFTNDVSQIQRLAWEPFFSSISSVASIVFSIIALFTFHWSLLIISLAAAIIIMTAPKLFTKNMEKYGKDNTIVLEQSTDYIKDNLLGFDVLRFFDRIELFKNAFQKISKKIEKSNFNLNYKNELSGNGIALVSIICQMLVNFYIGYLSIKGIIIQSAIMGGGNICGAIYNNLGNLGKYKLSFASASAIFEKALQEDDDEKGKEEKIAELKKSISLENVSFKYGDGPLVLDDMNINFEIGKKYALIGKSGRGKTTLLKLILGFLRDYDGKIFFDQKDIGKCNSEEIQKHLSYIEQNVYLFNTTIRNNITLFEEFPEEEIDEAIRISALTKDISSFENGLDTEVGEAGCNLSGGQRQRVAIARALLHKRNVLLVDEGTSALDKENADIIEKNLLAEKELTLIIVSHHLSDERKKQFDLVYEI